MHETTVAAAAADTTTRGTVELVTRLGPDRRPGNPTVAPDGRLLITLSALARLDLACVEILPEGGTRPFPDPAWAGKPGPDGRGIAATIGIDAAPGGTVWVLDMGALGEAWGEGPKLVGWDLATGALRRVFVLPRSALRPSSFCQDVVTDHLRGRSIIADMTLDVARGVSDHPAFVVVDHETGLCRRVLEDHPSMMPSGDPIVIDGKEVGNSGPDGRLIVHHYGLNPVAIDPACEWVYFGAMSGTTVWRVPAAALADAEMPAGELGGLVEVYCPKPHCDGIAVDGEGRVYVTDVENYAVGVATPQGYRVLAQDRSLLSWPDGLALDRKGWLYVTSNQLQHLPALNHGQDASAPPFHLCRIRVGDGEGAG